MKLDPHFLKKLTIQLCHTKAAVTNVTNVTQVKIAKILSHKRRVTAHVSLATGMFLAISLAVPAPPADALTASTPGIQKVMQSLGDNEASSQSSSKARQEYQRARHALQKAEHRARNTMSALPGSSAPNLPQHSSAPGLGSSQTDSKRSVLPKVNTAKPAPRIAKGRTKNVWTKHNGKKRRYLLYIPTNYRSTRPAPMLFGFGGWGDSPENFKAYSRMNTTGAHRNAIQVYPAGIDYAWEGAPYAKTRVGEDISFFKQIINEVDRTYAVNRNRVYAMGMSNGGGMTASIGCRAQDTFAGVVMVSSAFYNPMVRNCRRGSIASLIMHGTGDTMMRYNGGVRHGAGYASVPRVYNGFSQRNSCSRSQRVVAMAGGARRHIMQGCRKPTQLITIPQDHLWFWTPDAAHEVWGFLSRQHR